MVKDYLRFGYKMNAHTCTYAEMSREHVVTSDMTYSTFPCVVMPPQFRIAPCTDY